MNSHLNIKLRDSSLVKYRLLWFICLVLACLVKSPRSKSVSSSFLTAVYGKTHTSQTWLYISRLAHTTGSRARQKKKKAYQNSVRAASPLLCFIFSFCCLTTGQKMRLCKVMRMANVLIIIVNELWTKFSMGAIWCILRSVRIISQTAGGAVFGLKELLYNTLPINILGSCVNKLTLVFSKDALLINGVWCYTIFMFQINSVLLNLIFGSSNVFNRDYKIKGIFAQWQCM